MKKEIEAFPQNKEQANLNRLKFLSQNFYEWINDLPRIYHTQAALRQFNAIFVEIAVLADNASVAQESRIRRLETHIQKFMDGYKSGVMQAHKIPDDISPDYQVYGNKVYGISFDLIGSFRQMIVNESLRGSSADTSIRRQAEELEGFFERLFGQIEENIPISKDINYLQKIQKSIKLILDYSKQNEIFDKNTLKRLEDFRSSIQ